MRSGVNLLDGYSEWVDNSVAKVAKILSDVKEPTSVSEDLAW